MQQDSIQFDLDRHLRSIDLAWAAGLFEGEGTIYTVHREARVAQRTNRIEIRLCLTSTDEDVVRRFLAIVGVGAISRHPKTKADHPHYKDAFTWQVFGHKALPILRWFLPFLGERRRAKADEALELGTMLQLAPRDRTHCPRGHLYDVANTRLTHGRRNCRACDRLRMRSVRTRR